jgi:uncharacterized protein (DUF885 family)
VAYCRDLVPTEVEDDALRARLAEAGASAASAFASLLPVLEQLADEGGGGFAIGDERYSAMLRERELLDVDARGLRARGQEQYDLLAAELAEVAHAIAGHDDWRAVLVEANADRPETPEAMLAGYAEWTERAQRYLAEHGLVTLPDGESCRVVPSPPFQRPVLAVASYFAPPAFKPSLMGRFNVPYPPEGTSAEELAERLADNSYPSMPTTTVHEAYPGHHWHYVTMQGVRPLRRVASTSYFSEGWALYAERMMREQGFFDDPRYDLCHLDARIFRAARIIVDTSLHIGEMTYDEGVEFMHTKTSLTEPTARAEVGRYCSWPTQAASYLTGSLEIEKLRDRWLGEDHGDLREFHDRLCASGAMPPALAGRALFGS